MRTFLSKVTPGVLNLWRADVSRARSHTRELGGVTFVDVVCELVAVAIRAVGTAVKWTSGSSGRPNLSIAVWLVASSLWVARVQSASQGASAVPTFGDYACTVEKPVASIGGTIAVTAWVLPDSNTTPEYHWSVDAGKIDGVGRQVRWQLDGVRPGIHTASVQISAPGLVQRECAVQLVAVAGEIDLRSGNRASGRAWLLPGQEENRRAGMRSYLLFGAEPSATERDRYLRVLEEYLKFPSSEVLEKYYQSAKLPLDALNDVYLPLKSEPSPEVIGNRRNAASDRPAAEELLRRYDYERARIILADIEGEHHEGPYIVSYPGRADPSNQPYIFQNLSSVPSEVIPLWMREFLNLAAQQRDWSKPRTASFVLRLRTIIAVAGSSYGVVQQSVDELVAYYLK